MKIKNKQDFFFNFLNYSIIAILILVVLYPMVYILSASFSSPTRIAMGDVWLLPVDITLISYRTLVNYDYIWIGYGNTIFYTAVGTLINIAVTLMCAYPMARTNLRGRGPLMIMFTFTMLFGGGMIPNYLLVKNLGMLGTRWAVIIPGAMSVYNMIVARTFIQSNVPNEMLESTQMDGCNNTYFFFKMVLPLVKPIIAVLAMWYGVGHWNSYFNAFLYLDDINKMPLQIFLKEMLIHSQRLAEQAEEGSIVEDIASQHLAQGVKYAVIVLSSAPLMCVYPFVQKYFRQGVLMGSVKG